MALNRVLSGKYMSERRRVPRDGDSKRLLSLEYGLREVSLVKSGDLRRVIRALKTPHVM